MKSVKRNGITGIFSVWILMAVISGCNSLPGDGGTSTITGKIFVESYNLSGVLYQQYYAPDERVYIIYGDGTAFDDETRTSYDGTYEFKFMRKGTYTIFCYSDCPLCNGLTEPRIKTIEITGNHQEIVVDDIIIEKR